VQSAHDVALGDDALDRRAVGAHDTGTDSVLRKESEQAGNGLVWLDRDVAVTL
jgi:hypothetical protein